MADTPMGEMAGKKIPFYVSGYDRYIGGNFLILKYIRLGTKIRNG